MRRIVLLLIALVAVLLPACDSDGDDAPPALGSYAATFDGAYTAEAQGTATLLDVGAFAPLPGETRGATYALTLSPPPEAGPGSVPRIQITISQSDLDARALAFTPPDDGFPWLINATLMTAPLSPTGLWMADSGRVAFDVVSDERVSGTLEVRFSQFDRATPIGEMPVQRYTTAAGTFDALVVEAP